MIGAIYKYPGKRRRFQLVKIVAVTDTVFEDLVCVDAQIKLQF